MKRIFNLFILGAAFMLASCGTDVNVPAVDGNPEKDAQTAIELIKGNDAAIEKFSEEARNLSIDVKSSAKSEETLTKLFDEVVSAKKSVEVFMGNVEHAYADSLKLSEFTTLFNQSLNCCCCQEMADTTALAE